MKTETTSHFHLAAPQTKRATVSKAHDAEPFKCGLPAMNAASFLGGLVLDIARAPMDALEAQRAAYVKLLQRHDWHYAMADDASVYRKGRDELSELRMVQRELDKDGAIWNAHAPDGHKLGQF